MAILNIFKKRTKKQNTLLYKDCYDLSIYNFDIIFKTKDFRYLVPGYDGYNDIDIPIGAGKRWNDIYHEWIKLSDSNTMIYYYQLLSEVAYLETRYVATQVLIYEIYTQNMNEKTLDMYIEALKVWRYFYNKDNDKLAEVERLTNQHIASKNKIGLKRSELDRMKDEFSDNEQTLVGQAVILEQITGRNNIDIKTTSVAKWLEIGKIANNINEQRRRNGK